MGLKGHVTNVYIYAESDRNRTKRDAKPSAPPIAYEHEDDAHRERVAAVADQSPYVVVAVKFAEGARTRIG
jgi:hypothetical protein